MFDFTKKPEKVLIGIYVIQDTVAATFGIPIPLESEGLAKRQFVDFLAQPNIFPHRVEFALVKIADYCSATATFYPIKKEERPEWLFSDVSEEVMRVYDERYNRHFKAIPGAAVGAEPPQAASSDL